MLLQPGISSPFYRLPGHCWLQPRTCDCYYLEPGSQDIIKPGVPRPRLHSPSRDALGRSCRESGMLRAARGTSFRTEFGDGREASATGSATTGRAATSGALRLRRAGARQTLRQHAFYCTASLGLSRREPFHHDGCWRGADRLQLEYRCSRRRRAGVAFRHRPLATHPFCSPGRYVQSQD